MIFLSTAIRQREFYSKRFESFHLSWHLSMHLVSAEQVEHPCKSTAFLCAFFVVLDASDIIFARGKGGPDVVCFHTQLATPGQVLRFLHHDC